MCHSRCSVCLEAEWSENRIISCSGCKIGVHEYCYGIKKIGNVWKCSPCFELGENVVSCLFCKKFGGAMKQTACKKFVHTICALFTPDTQFENVANMEIVNISNVKMFFKSCHFCKETTPFTIKCFESNCSNRFHVTCAHENKALKEHVPDAVQLIGYCITHKKSSRRLTSEVIKDAFYQKNVVRNTTELNVMSLDAEDGKLLP